MLGAICAIVTFFYDKLIAHNWTLHLFRRIVWAFRGRISAPLHAGNRLRFARKRDFFKDNHQAVINEIEEATTIFFF